MVKSVTTTAYTHAGRPVRVEFAPVDGPKGPQVRIRTAEEIIYLEREELAEIVVAIFGRGKEAAQYQPRHGGEK